MAAVSSIVEVESRIGDQNKLQLVVVATIMNSVSEEYEERQPIELAIIIISFNFKNIKTITD